MRHDAREARRQILKALRDPPELDFKILHPLRLKCVEPKLDRPSSESSNRRQARGRNRAKEQHQILTEARGILDQSTSKLEYGRTTSSEQHRILTEARGILDQGTSKLEYGRTTSEEWDRYFRFATDRLTQGADGSFQISQRASNEGDDYINSTKEGLQDWFINNLLPRLDGKANAAFYILGEPGAGKSTLIKYLINKNANHLSQKNIVFSRFEFLKFFYKWKQESEDIKYALEIYISYILLRDIILSYQYNHINGALHRVQVGLFAPGQIMRTLRDAISVRSILDRDMENALAEAANVIERASGATEFRATMLAEIPHDIRAMIAAYFADNKCEIALVVDGLDCISLEDVEFNTERTQIMKTISANTQRLTNFSIFSYGREAKIIAPSSTIFVMRENTFYFYQYEYVDIHRPDRPLFFVKEIDPKVAMFNALTRATDRWANAQGMPDEVRDERKQLLWKATYIPIRFISSLLRLRRHTGSLDDIFAGNIRTSFIFMRALLDWFLDDAVSLGKLTLDRNVTTTEILRLMTGPDGWHLLRQRNYRILELLLFGEGRWFENAVMLIPPESFFDQNRRDWTLRDNGDFHGFADNVFNYHVQEHGSGGNDHCLLEKIRIIQLLQNNPMGVIELETRLRERIGYESIDIRKTLIILARSQLVSVHFDKNRELTFSASARGVICALHLARSMSYLEHVFHRILFPEELVRFIKDRIRSKGVEEWTTASIRNLYVFLTYLKFVEDNPGCGKPVPYTMRIYQHTADRVIAVVERILSPSEPSERLYQVRGEGEARWETIAINAERLIDNMRGHWEQAGLIKADVGEDSV